MNCQIIRKPENQIHRWGGGVTSEIFLYPPATSVSSRNFELRISTASVETEETAFSDFTGYERHIMPLTGEMAIVHEGIRKVKLTPYDIDIFDGAWTTWSTGIYTDFNLLYNRNWHGRVEPAYHAVKISGVKNGFTGFFAQQPTRVTLGKPTEKLSPGDFLVMENCPDLIPETGTDSPSGIIVKAERITRSFLNRLQINISHPLQIHI